MFFDRRRRVKNLIPKDLYKETSKFVDKNTFVQYVDCFHQTNSNILQELRQSYLDKFKPFEDYFQYKDSSNSIAIDDAFFQTKPIILLIGQYSTGKSTFVKYLIERDYPGIRIGPEPTTDKFVAVIYGKEDSIVPGNALVIDRRQPFGSMEKFGGKFLNRFQAAFCDSPILEGLTIIDTPGILSNNVSDNGYDFKAVIERFASQSDRIYLFLDAHKLELSTEFRQIVRLIKRFDDKLRIILNKTDLLNDQEMIRVYGALMWFLGQVIEEHQAMEIFIGSFLGKALVDKRRKKLYESEEYRLFEDLSNLQQESLLRKLNLLVQRTRKAIIHYCLISLFKKQLRKSIILRFLFPEQIKLANLHRKKLEKLCEKMRKNLEFSSEELPDLNEMRKTLLKLNLNRTNTKDKVMIARKNSFIEHDLPKIIEKINNGKFRTFQITDQEDPFRFARDEGFDEGSLDPNDWIVAKHRHIYDPIFESLKDGEFKVTASKAKAQMLQSQLPAKILNKIWTWSDLDCDGQLDRDEFALAMYLTNLAKQNFDLPERLPKHLIPISKRQ
ncbi:AP-2 complex subunit sigma-like [Sarcoptes scabiei]|nr:AP-2 complex subunit sigma-like [Sarcoptes scabiei]